MTTNETIILKDFYSALNRNDIPCVIAFFDPEILRIEWEGTPSEGIFRGLSEVEAHFVKGRSTWAEGGCHPEEIFVSGNKAVVFVHVKVRVKDKSDWAEGRIADGFVFRNGKIIEFRSFFERKDALHWAGLQNH